MEDEPGDTSSVTTRGTSLQMADINASVANASPVTRMRNLEAAGEMLHVTMVVRHQNARTWV